MSTSTATAYKYNVAGHLSFSAPKYEKAQKSSGFWANRTYGFCIKDNVLIDPCMGSGHILVYAFDVLMQIYESAGYGQREAASNILENNLYGLDIDDRAFQMAYFAVMMKARQYNRRILNGEYKPNLYSIQESNGINRNQLQFFGAGLNKFEKNSAIVQIKDLLDIFKNAKEFGSLLMVDQYDWDLLSHFVANIEVIGQMSMDTLGLEDTAEELKQLIVQGKVLAHKYDVTITNPPYMAISNSSPELNDYINKYYIGGKTDLYSAFIERCLQYTRQNSYLSMITMQSWMFLTSFQAVREKVLNYEIVNMTHLGPHGFDEISGEVVQTTSFAILKGHMRGKYNGTYARLIDGGNEKEKEQAFFSGDSKYVNNGNRFSKIPNKLIVYWESENFLRTFEGDLLSKSLNTREGLSPADNERFLRLWPEIETGKDKKWFPYQKGGQIRKWYGNNDYLVNWENDGLEIRNNRDKKTGRVRSHNYNGEFAGREGLTWSAISTSGVAFRYVPKGFLFDSAGSMGFAANTELLKYILGILNSCFAKEAFSFISPTIKFMPGHITMIPYKTTVADKQKVIVNYVDECIRISKNDWDSLETSWDFEGDPLVNKGMRRSHWNVGDVTIEECYRIWSDECDKRFVQLKSNEEELNRIFIDIYGLRDDLTPEVEDKDLTVRRANLQRDIKALLSFAVGCMFGRYSLSYTGLAYAGGEWDEGKYIQFKPDDDNIIPISDEEYLEDDIVSRLCTFLKVAFGEVTLEDNLDYIAKALGNKGDSSRNIIRNYFLNEFFKDHCQTYSVTGSGKRPIYWLFDSGKQNGFKALVYLHRYNVDTIGKLRIDYLHRMQRVYESEISRMQDMIDHSTNVREVGQATKRRDKLAKQLKECREYDEKLAHLALSRIVLDLDDGVKVNYRKIQTANDGKFYEVLADSKNIMAKK